ncbi:MAG TPA: hypothetical protein VF221_15165, partial [Chloroflexota bacterium]
SRGRRRFVSILLPQAITSAALSPSGRFIAFAAPTACYTCTLNVFDMKDFSLWHGPTGMGDESELAWTSDGRCVITDLHGKVTAIDAERHDERSLGIYPAMPLRWQHSLLVRLAGNTAQLADRVTGQVYRPSRGPGTA